MWPDLAVHLVRHLWSHFQDRMRSKDITEIDISRSLAIWRALEIHCEGLWDVMGLQLMHSCGLSAGRSPFELGFGAGPEASQDSPMHTLEQARRAFGDLAPSRGGSGALPPDIGAGALIAPSLSAHRQPSGPLPDSPMMAGPEGAQAFAAVRLTYFLILFNEPPVHCGCLISTFMS